MSMNVFLETKEPLEVFGQESLFKFFQEHFRAVSYAAMTFPLESDDISVLRGSSQCGGNFVDEISKALSEHEIVYIRFEA